MRKEVNSTIHGIQRINERIGLHAKKKQRKTIESAFKRGYNPTDFIRGDFRNYLNSKKQSVKVFGNNIYVFDGRKRLLITVLNIPEHFKPYKQFLKINNQEEEG